MACRPLSPILALALAFGLGRLNAAAPEVGLPPLAERVQELIRQPRFAAASWGIQVVSLDTGAVLVEHNAGKLFLPASGTKLFTAALALHELGPEFRIRTSLYGPAAPVAGILTGDLILYGRGDPTVLGQAGTGPDPLESLADQVWAAGVRTITGDLVGDDSYFALPPYGSGWECGDLAFGFGAEPSALSVHDNSVDLRIYPGTAPDQPCLVFAQPGQGLLSIRNQTRTGPGPAIRVSRELGDSTLRVTGTLAPGAAPVQTRATLHDPALLFARLLHRALLRRGIQIHGQARSLHYQDRPVALDPAGRVELAHLSSPPLASIVRATLKDSVNLNAELLLLQTGLASAGPASEARGLAALARFLPLAGVNPDEVLLEEGSGLSRKNLVTPRAMVALLSYLSRSPEAAVIRASLPVAGLDGTLRTRLENSAAAGNLQAKTGTLRYCHSLSGYVRGADGQHLAFALLLNNYRPDPKGPSGQAALDAVAAALAGPGACPSNIRPRDGAQKRDYRAQGPQED